MTCDHPLFEPIFIFVWSKVKLVTLLAGNIKDNFTPNNPQLMHGAPVSTLPLKTILVVLKFLIQLKSVQTKEKVLRNRNDDQITFERMFTLAAVCHYERQ